MLTDQSEAALRAANDQLRRELAAARTELAAAERRVAELEGGPVASRLPPAGGSLPELREGQALLPCPVCGRHHERIDIQRGAWRAVEIITDNKWALVVLYVLSRGATQRYNQLLRMITGVSQKMLTQTLRSLERDGLIARTVYPEVPPHVEYAMTPLGKSLVGLLEEMCRWADEQYGGIVAARARYDEELAKRQG